MKAENAASRIRARIAFTPADRAGGLADFFVTIAILDPVPISTILSFIWY
jgi:hypothetical protein